MTLQYMTDEASVTLLRYDLPSKRFSLIDEIKEVDGQTGVGVSNLNVDPTGEYVSIDLIKGSLA